MKINGKYITLLDDLYKIKNDVDTDITNAAIALQKNVEKFINNVISDFGISIDDTKFTTITLGIKIKSIQTKVLSRKEVSTLYRIKKIGNQAARGNVESNKLTKANISGAISNYSKILEDFSINVETKVREYKSKMGLYENT